MSYVIYDGIQKKPRRVVEEIGNNSSNVGGSALECYFFNGFSERISDEEAKEIRKKHNLK